MSALPNTGRLDERKQIKFKVCFRPEADARILFPWFGDNLPIIFVNDDSRVASLYLLNVVASFLENDFYRADVFEWFFRPGVKPRDRSVMLILLKNLR